ncbi:DUF2180 family protein [Streptomyces halotolerans]|uniref:DUF2180 family protein n=1 Tax=Streptomyces pratisoli TaxID=3139917 RepID=A0ACC6QUE1_9ACTN|nr:DUF2180 family protein [Streptomyces sp. NBC_00259]
MNCFDCATNALRPVQAVAVAACARCGAGMCRTHLHVTSDPPPGAPGSSAPAPEARRLTCDVCYAAERAAAGLA